MAIPVKRIETRNWRASYTGLLAIHQSKGLSPIGGRRGFAAQCAEYPFADVLTEYLEEFDGRPRDVGDSIPLGAIVCVVDLIGYYSTNFHQWELPNGARMEIPHSGDNEYYFGNYSPMRWAWVTRSARRVWPPIYTPGKQGLRDVDPDIEAEILRRLK